MSEEEKLHYTGSALELGLRVFLACKCDVFCCSIVRKKIIVEVLLNWALRFGLHSSVM